MAESRLSTRSLVNPATIARPDMLSFSSNTSRIRAPAGRAQPTTTARFRCSSEYADGQQWALGSVPTFLDRSSNDLVRSQCRSITDTVNVTSVQVLSDQGCPVGLAGEEPVLRRLSGPHFFAGSNRISEPSSSPIARVHQHLTTGRTSFAGFAARRALSTIRREQWICVRGTEGWGSDAQSVTPAALRGSGITIGVRIFEGLRVHHSARVAPTLESLGSLYARTQAFDGWDMRCMSHGPRIMQRHRHAAPGPGSAAASAQWGEVSETSLWRASAAR